MKTRLDMNKIARGLRAERQGKVPAGGGYFGAMRLLADIETRFRVPAGKDDRTTQRGGSRGISLPYDGERRGDRREGHTHGCDSRPVRRFRRDEPVEGRRLQNVSTTRVESRGFGWTAANETERCNCL
jgi:hypothetical protein